MEKKSKSSSFKIAAIVSWMILLVSIAWNIVLYYQTKYQLTSPFIPKTSIAGIAQPYIFRSLISGILLIIAMIFYFYSKYIITIAICLITLILQPFHFFIYNFN